PGRPRAADARPGEHAQVRGRRPADELRHLLGRRGRRGLVARRGSRDPRGDRLRRAAFARAHAPAASAASCTRARPDPRMKYLRSFGLFWWNFVVGDDWRVAAGLAVALALTWLLERADVTAWWLLPVAVGILLGESVRRESRSRERRRDPWQRRRGGDEVVRAGERPRVAGERVARPGCEPRHVLEHRLERPALPAEADEHRPVVGHRAVRHVAAKD